MNKKWLDTIDSKDLGGWTKVVEVLYHDFKRFNLKPEHVLFIIDILSNNEGYRIYDEKMTNHGCTRTLNRFRKDLRALKYMTWDVYVKKDEDGKYKSSGFLYNLDGLLDAIIQNKPHQYPKDKPVLPKDKPVLENARNVQLLKNNISKEEYNIKNNKETESLNRTTSGTESILDSDALDTAGFIYIAPQSEKEDFMDKYSSIKILARFHHYMKQFIKSGHFYNKDNALATIEANMEMWSKHYDDIKFMPYIWKMFSGWRELQVAPSTFEKYFGWEKLESNLYELKDMELREMQKVLSQDVELLERYAEEYKLPFNKVEVRSFTDIQFKVDERDAFNGYDYEKQRMDMVRKLYDIWMKETNEKEVLDKKSDKITIFDKDIRDAMNEEEYATYLLKQIEEDV